MEFITLSPLPTNILRDYDRSGLEETSPTTSLPLDYTQDYSTPSTTNTSQTGYEHIFIRQFKSIQHNILSYLHRHIRRLSHWKHVNQVLVFNRQHRAIPAFSVFQPLLQLTCLEDVLFIVILMILVLVSDHSILSFRYQVLLLHACWLMSLLHYDLQLHGVTLMQCILPSWLIQWYMDDDAEVLRTAQYRQNRRLPAKTYYNDNIIYSSVLSHSDLSIAVVRILQPDDIPPPTLVPMDVSDEVNAFLQQLHRTEEEDLDNDNITEDATPSETDLAARLQFQITVQCGHRPRWTVWQTYADCRRAYPYMVQTYPFDYIPGYRPGTSCGSFIAAIRLAA